MSFFVTSTMTSRRHESLPKLFSEATTLRTFAHSAAFQFPFLGASQTTCMYYSILLLQLAFTRSCEHSVVLTLEIFGVLLSIPLIYSETMRFT